MLAEAKLYVKSLAKVGDEQYYGIHFMNKILCPHCDKSFELDQAITHQLKSEMQSELESRNKEELAKKIAQAEEKIKQKAQEETEFLLKNSKNELEEAKERNKQLQEQLLELNKSLRALRDQSEKQELENQKRLNLEIDKIRETVVKTEQERSSLEKKELEKKIEDMQKALEEAQRKGHQSSQQLQGEVLELQLEEMLKTAFPHDDILPVGKGITGADVKHAVKSPKGYECGVILWEFKRTKDWSDKWIIKLKEDLRNSKAHIPVIVSMQMPKEAESGFGVKDGVWICNHALVIPLATVLRKSLLDLGYQKAISANKEGKSEILYTYITSHEFQQQVENLIEAYMEIQTQIVKEKMAFEKIWKQREIQAQRIFKSTANIYAALQGTVGTSMPQIKGLELSQLDSGNN